MSHSCKGHIPQTKTDSGLVTTIQGSSLQPSESFSLSDRHKEIQLHSKVGQNASVGGESRSLQWAYIGKWAKRIGVWDNSVISFLKVLVKITVWGLSHWS